MESHTKFSSIKKSYHLFWKVSSTMWTKHSIIWKILSLTSRAYSLHGRVSNLVWKLSCSIWEVSILIRKWNKRFEVLRMCGNRRECEFYPSSWRSRTTVATQAPVTGKCFEGFCILSVYVYQIMLTTRCQSPAPLTETKSPADDSFLDMAVQCEREGIRWSRQNLPLEDRVPLELVDLRRHVVNCVAGLGLLLFFFIFFLLLPVVEAHNTWRESCNARKRNTQMPVRKHFGRK